MKVLFVFLIAAFISNFVYAQDTPVKKEKRPVTIEEEVDGVKEVVNDKVIWNERCPVMGGKIDKEANTVEYDGKTYGFCCNGCDKKFQKDPGKFSSNLSEDGKQFIGKKK
jgi:YHS domain-containing protein